jgi:hypothetical protein
MKNGVEDLRNNLFALLEELADPDTAQDKERLDACLRRAKAGSEVAQTIINSAKVEVEHLRAAADAPRSGKGSRFFSPPPALSLGSDDDVPSG